MLAFLAFAVVSLFLYPLIGRDFFPSVDAGQLRLHVRCPPGTRIEQTEVYFQQVEDYIRQVIPAEELAVINDNIGLPNNINLALSDSVSVGPSGGEILVALNAAHGPTPKYLETLREELRRTSPIWSFSVSPRTS
jgi:multidrug efflux pump subunit AcrB